MVLHIITLKVQYSNVSSITLRGFQFILQCYKSSLIRVLFLVLIEMVSPVLRIINPEPARNVSILLRNVCICGQMLEKLENLFFFC